MGTGKYNDGVYATRVATAHATGASLFTHDADVTSGKVDNKVHPLLDPSKLNSVGKLVRESFDSPDHPESLAVALGWDTTGSMQQVPEIFAQRLHKVMAMLIKKGYVKHPQIMMAAYNDATTSAMCPLQVGQFESGNEMDDCLTKIRREGGGGGHITESAELLMYFLARHTDMDCVNKRGDKGLCFIIGDELMYPTVDPHQVERIIGDRIQAPILVSPDYVSAEMIADPKDTRVPRIKALHCKSILKAEGDLLSELREKFEVHWIMPGGTSNYNNDEVVAPLKAMFGENFHRLDKPEDICEFLVMIIGVSRGFDIHDIRGDIVASGGDRASADRSTTALAAYSSTRSVTRTATTSGTLIKQASNDGVDRL